MIIKPECDVETVEDFAQYYSGSYMEARDGRILQVVSAHGRNLVLRDYSVLPADEGDGHVMLPWRQVQSALVYGRPPSSMIKARRRAYMMYMSNNRQAGRGFKGEYYLFQEVESGRAFRPSSLGNDYELARAAHSPVYVTIQQALLAARVTNEDSLLDGLHTLCRTSESFPSPLVYRRGKTVGWFDDEDRLHLRSGNPFVGEHFVENLGYTGVIFNEAA